MKLPESISNVIKMLENCGFEAYVVGGCVRDFLLGNVPKDYDVTTSATPNEVKAVFAGFRIIETGIKHGTVTVVYNEMPVEITTFRVDGDYSDNRHPDSVSFSCKLEDDLSRRDFTINAMAYNPNTGLIDIFGGRSDLENCIVKSVGEPELRFEEDSLRILRGLRFAARYGFSIDERTAEAMHNKKWLLQNIAAERINVEFTGILCGKCKDILRDFVDVIGIFLPEIIPCVGFSQHTKYHNKDVYEHIIATVEAVRPEIYLRLTMFFHDIGKPKRFIMKDGIGHFYGHGIVSTEIAEEVMRRLKFGTKMIEKVLFLVKYHDVNMSENDVGIKRQLNKYGKDNYFDLLTVHIADNMGKADKYANRNFIFEELRNRALNILESEPCITLKSLSIKGGDVIKLGYNGAEVGKVLEFCLNAVIENKCENDKQKLLDFIKRYFLA